MRVFFDEALRKDQAAHVICFRHKAVCLTGPAFKHKDKTFKDVLALRGWRAFRKHEHLFPHPHFIFSEDIFECGNDFKILHIYVINKESLIKCLCENDLFFKKMLGYEFSPRSFIKKLEEGISLPSLLNNDEELMGVLLGFGQESAHAYKEMRAHCTTTFAPSQT